MTLSSSPLSPMEKSVVEFGDFKKVESKGMLLAAKNGDELALLGVDKDLPAGSVVG